ncbi:alpha-glucuronidase family glycosyl hydrolase [Kriegella aquimaris]|uniref:Glycosyl hydrolase family 67 N-terminus n=1 Tax=Kriegella aquimaris TaxID=192904 RepID=A0A1G9N3W7_9FLAO|nr:alpha-glucuronidase family glycosyl hydrolase [Kriegella aquimaris]SDL81190.1 Glycosyl hydrolase family 67 N-terminus [Kriegella aquimaris]
MSERTNLFSLILFCILVGGMMPNTMNSQTMDMSTSKIVCFEKKNPLVLKSISVLHEEVVKRTHIQLRVQRKWPTESQPTIVIGLKGQLDKFPQEYQEVLETLPATQVEGYKIAVLPKSKTVLVVGNDPRGVLYGIGNLLRKMEMGAGEILVPVDIQISSSPKYPIRGHQLGYRPKTNSYDAWSASQFDSYIRDLAIFGANSIEIMPPRTDDDFTSVHMQVPVIEMIEEQSKICDSYGMDVWMWYPNLGKDYENSDSVKLEIEERHKIFKALPRLDALFVPGGDPGDLEPDVLFNWLAQEAEVLNKYHPNAKIWVSPQAFRPTKAWFDAFYGHVNKEYSWFGGIVFGPWIKTPIQEIRKRINTGIPIRRYPDITHSLSSQYPIPKWDLAYAITLGRECINPRPTDEKMIHNAIDDYAQGSISYSEGTNDDVNKMIWTAQDWDPNSPVIDALRDYARFFVGNEYTEGVAQGLIALEKNLEGPLLTNESVVRTLQQWQELEKKATPEVLLNFRFQMGLIRAYFDAYQYRRLIYETELEQMARQQLILASKEGSKIAIKKARETLSNAWEVPVMVQWKERCLELADALFNSIGAQLTIEKHFAAAGRGNFIDNIDVPLNDAMWLLDQLGSIEKRENEEVRLEEIDKMLERNNPGPGGFYDNFGSLRSWERVVSHVSRELDPGDLVSPRTGFGVGLKGEEWVHEVTAKGFEGQSTPLAWMNQVTTLYDQPLEIVYNNLDPKSSYKIRVAYTGRFRSRIKMTADDILVHDFIKTGVQPIYEFKIPEDAIKDGDLKLEWTCGEGERGSQVSEIWIIRDDITQKEQ